MRQTPLSQLLTSKLDVDLAEFVIERRNAGKGWRPIAAELRTKTGVPISNEALRVWFLDELETVVHVRARSA